MGFTCCSMPAGKKRRSKRIAAQLNPPKQPKTAEANAEKPVSEATSEVTGIRKIDDEVSFTFTSSQLDKLLNQAADKALERAGVKPKDTNIESTEQSKSKAQQAVPTGENEPTPTTSTTHDGETSDVLGKDLSDVIMQEGESKVVLQVTGGVPLDLHVSKKLREKILSEEYVELGELLERDPDKLETFNISMSNSKMIAKSRSTQIRNFKDWDQAWDIFMCVYGRKEVNKSKLTSLIKHRSHVKDVHDRQGRWQFYDRQFRKLKALLGDQLSWDTLHTEIFMKAMMPEQRSGDDYAKVTSFKPPPGKGRANLPLGHCWNSIKGLPCRRDPCSLKHFCKKCNQAHKLDAQCNFRGSPKQEKQPKPPSSAQSSGSTK